MEKVCESALFHQKNESYPKRGAENAQKDAVASKVYLTFDATAPFVLRGAPFVLRGVFLTCDCAYCIIDCRLLIIYNL